MNVQSLEQLAAKPISRRTPLPCPIPGSSGNIVIEESWWFSYNDMLSNMNATHVDFSFSSMLMEKFEALANYHLELFKFGSSLITEHMSVIKCFCECWKKSHQSLTNLTTPNLEKYDKYWLHTLLENFINLSSLNLSKKLYTSFPSLGRPFHQLLCLNISDTSISNLKGISNLPNLVILHIRNLRFATAEDIEEIFKLTKLRVLDASQVLPEDEREHRKNDDENEVNNSYEEWDRRRDEQYEWDNESVWQSEDDEEQNEENEESDDVHMRLGVGEYAIQVGENAWLVLGHGLPNGVNEVQEQPRNNIVQLLVEQNKSLPDLRFFNGSNTQIDNDCLDKFLRLNRNVFHVVLYKTTIANVVRDNITVASTSDLKQAIELLKFHTDNDPNHYSRHILEDIHGLLEAGISFDAHEPTLREYFDLLLKKVLAKDADDVYEEKLWAVKNVLLFCKFYASNLSPKKIQHVVSVMMAKRNSGRLSYCILSIPFVSQTPGLDVAFLYEKVLDFLLSWEEEAYSDEYILIMVDVLVTFHAKTTEETRRRIGNDKRCVESLRSILLKVCPKYDGNDIEFLDICRRVQAAITSLVDGWNFAIGNTSYLKLFNFIYDCPNPAIKEILLKHLKKMTYRIDYDRITLLTEKLDFQKLLSFLVEDLKLSYNSTGMKINLGVAVAALEVLEILMGQTNRGRADLERQLFLATRVNNSENYQIPVKRDGQEIYTSVDCPRDEWPERMLAEINTRIQSTTEENTAMFNENRENVDDPRNVVNIRGEIITVPLEGLAFWNDL